MTEVENSKNESNWGGKREGSGRKKGGENAETKRKKVVKKEMEKRIIRSVDHILNAQMNLATGVSYLMHVFYTGKNRKKHVETVTDQETIEAYFSGDLDDSENNDWYYMSTEKTDNRAIDSLFDRTFGKARQNIGLDGGEDDKPIAITGIKYVKPDSTTTDNKTTSGVGGSKK